MKKTYLILLGIFVGVGIAFSISVLGLSIPKLPIFYIDGTTAKPRGTYDFDFLAGDLTTTGVGTLDSLVVDANTVNLSDTTDEYVLAFDTTTQTWRGVVDQTGAGGQAIVLDLGDDGGDDSTDLGEIATTGDTNSIFSEPTADKLLIAVGNNWPTADEATALAANGGNCNAGEYALGVDASGAVESCTDATTEIDTVVATKDECSEITNCVPSAWDALTDMVLTDNYIYVGDVSNDPVGVAMSNDCTIASNGAITCDHDALDNFLATEHVDWAGAAAGTIHTDNYIENYSHTGEVTGATALTIADSIAVTSWNLTTPTFTTSATVTDAFTLGLGGGKGLIQFDDEATDFISLMNAYVGIGTATPNAPLEVRDDFQGVVGGFASGILHITNKGTDANDNAVITGHNSNSTNKQLWYLGSTTNTNDNIAFINRQSGTLSLSTNNTQRLTIDATGNVGIGVTDPDTKLEVFNAGDQLKLSFDGTDNAVFAVDTNGDLTITPSGTQIIVSGNISATNLSGTNTGDNDEVGTLTSGDLCINDGSVVNCTVNTIAELETALDATNVLIETEIDASSELLNLMDDETGSGLLVFGTAPTFTTGITITGADHNPGSAGEIRYDNTITGIMSGGGLRWYDDDSIRLLVDLETDPADDDYVVAYDSTADGFYMKLDATGGSTAWDDIGNPDANDEIDFAAYVIELNVENFQIGDGGANFVDFNGTPLLSFQGNADINLPDDSVDAADMNWGDMTDLTTGGTVVWGNITAGELANDSIIDADIDDDGNFTFTGTWDFSGGDIVLPALSVDAGTYAADSIDYADIVDADQATTKCILIETPDDADDLMFFRNNRAATVTSVDCICEAATSAVVVIVECDSAGDNCGSSRFTESLTCDVDGATDDGVAETGIVAGAWLRAQVGTVTGTPGHVTACITFTYDD